jgi:HK97 family phage major capsid protein
MSNIDDEFEKVVEGVNKGFQDFKKTSNDRLVRMENSMARKAKFSTGDAKNEGEESLAIKDWLKGGSLDTKALSTTNDGQGVVVRSDWADQIFKLIRESSPMRQVANIRGTDSNEIEFLVDRGEASSAWTAETGTRSETALDFMTRHKIANHEHYSYPSATQQMLEDSSFDVEGWIQTSVGTRFARQEADAFINGNGTGKPRGILDYGTVANDSFAWGADPSLYEVGAVYSGVDGALAASDPDDAIYDLVDSLKVDYLQNASFLMTRKMRNLLRKMKDSTDRSLLQASLSDTVPDRLMGYPIRLAEDMPDLAADVVGILFGDFRQAYSIVDRLGVAVLRDPGYSKPGFVRWYVRKRVGGALTNPEAVKALVLGTAPA